VDMASTNIVPAKRKIETIVESAILLGAAEEYAYIITIEYFYLYLPRCGGSIIFRRNIMIIRKLIISLQSKYLETAKDRAIG
jgi:hypothetical protein